MNNVALARQHTHHKGKAPQQSILPHVHKHMIMGGYTMNAIIKQECSRYDARPAHFRDLRRHSEDSMFDQLDDLEDELDDACVPVNTHAYNTHIISSDLSTAMLAIMSPPPVELLGLPTSTDDDDSDRQVRNTHVPILHSSTPSNAASKWHAPPFVCLFVCLFVSLGRRGGVPR